MVTRSTPRSDAPCFTLPPAEAQERWTELCRVFREKFNAELAVPLFRNGMMDLSQLDEIEKCRAEVAAVRREMDEFMGQVEHRQRTQA